jgi:hypothetical protein
LATPAPKPAAANAIPPHNAADPTIARVLDFDLITGFLL